MRERGKLLINNARRHFTVNGAPVAPSAIGFGVLASVGGFLFGYDIVSTPSVRF